MGARQRRNLRPPEQLARTLLERYRNYARKALANIADAFYLNLQTQPVRGGSFAPSWGAIAQNTGALARFALLLAALQALIRGEQGKNIAYLCQS